MSALWGYSPRNQSETIHQRIAEQEMENVPADCTLKVDLTFVNEIKSDTALDVFSSLEKVDL